MGKTLIASLSLLLLVAARPMPEQKLLEEMRIALVDLQQSVRTQKLDIELLQEQLGQKKGDTLIETRLAELEKNAQSLSQDLQKIAQHTNQLSASLSGQIQGLKTELKKFEGLQSTLEKVALALDQGSVKHKVRSGETLEKIARQHGTSVEALKRRNNLSSSTILVDQELLLPEK